MNPADTPGTVVTHVVRDPRFVEYLPTRVTKNYAALSDLGPSRLKGLLGLNPDSSLPPTANVQEFMEALGAYMPQNKALKSFLGNGTLLPSPEFLATKIPAILAECGHPELAEPLENMVIDNRLRIIGGLQRLRDSPNGPDTNASIGKSVQLLPKRYWDAALAKANDPVAWKANPARPEWESLMQPITCKHEYLRAARHSAGLDSFKAGITTGLRHTTIEAIESGTRPANSARLFDECEKLGTLYASRTDLFKKEVLDALPIKQLYTRKSRNQGDEGLSR